MVRQGVPKWMWKAGVDHLATPDTQNKLYEEFKNTGTKGVLYTECVKKVTGAATGCDKIIDGKPACCTKESCGIRGKSTEIDKSGKIGAWGNAKKEAMPGKKTREKYITWAQRHLCPGKLRKKNIHPTSGIRSIPIDIKSTLHAPGRTDIIGPWGIYEESEIRKGPPGVSDTIVGGAWSEHAGIGSGKADDRRALLLGSYMRKDPLMTPEQIGTLIQDTEIPSIPITGANKVISAKNSKIKKHVPNKPMTEVFGSDDYFFEKQQGIKNFMQKRHEKRHQRRLWKKKTP